MEILRDSIWQFVGVVIAIISLIAVVWIYLLQKNKKNLSYEILTSNELLTASEEIRGRIKISFDERPVQNVHLLVVKFTNDGNVSILDTDFYEPLRITFPQGTEVLSVEMIGHYPDSFHPKIDWEASPVTIIPTLINSRESFEIKFLLAQYAEKELQIRGRIVGVTEITEAKRDTIWGLLWLLSGVFVFGTFSSLFLAIFLPSQLPFFLILFLTSLTVNLAFRVFGFVPKDSSKKK